MGTLLPCAPPVSTRLQSRWGWLLLVFPLIGVGELQAHLTQRAAAVTAVDYARARTEAGPLGPDDTIVFAPRWADPVGREAFPAMFAHDLLRAAPAELSRFEHVLEIASHGATEPELAAWPVQWEKTVGKLTLRMHDNRDFSKVVDPLTNRVGTDRLIVSQGGKDCPLQRGNATAQAWGPATPAVRYACAAGAVGQVVVPDLSYRLRYCLFTPASPTPIRLRFVDVPFGSLVRVAYGLHTDDERSLSGAPVTLRALVQTDTAGGGVEDVELGRIEHHDGEGWRTSDVPTPKLVGQTGDLHLEVSSTGGRRPFCFEAFAR